MSAAPAPRYRLPLSDRLELLADLRRERSPSWHALLDLFADGEAFLLLGRADAQGAAVLASAGWPEALPRVSLDATHLLRKAWRAIEPIQWNPGAGGDSEAAARFDLPLRRAITKRHRTFELPPVDALAVAVGGGRVFVRLAFDAARAADGDDIAIARLLSEAVHPGDEEGSAALQRWAADLALLIVGAHDSGRVLSQGLAALKERLPALEALYLEGAASQRGLRPRASTSEESRVSSTYEPYPEVFAAVLESARPLRFADRENEPRLLSGEWAARLLPAGQALLLYPVRWNDVSLGVLAIGVPSSDAFGALDVALPLWESVIAPALATASAFEAIERSERANEAELALAAIVQRSLLPEPLETDAWAFRVYHDAEARLAGDFVLLDRTPSQWQLAIGDVAGRGVAASLTMMSAWSLLLQQLRPGSALPEALGQWSAAVHERSNLIQASGGELTYVTAIVLRCELASGAVQYCKAGHPYPLHYRADGRLVETWDASGFPAGMFEDQVFEEAHAALDPGDVVLLYTDGVTEARGPSGLLGLEALKRTLRAFGDYPLAVLDDALRQVLEQHLREATVGDDTTWALLQRRRDRGQWAAIQRLEQIAEAATGLTPELQSPIATERLEAVTGIREAWVALQSALGDVRLEPGAEGWRLEDRSNARLYHAALTLDGAEGLLGAESRPSLCLKAFDAPGHPLRGFARRVDFCWVERGTLHFVRKW